MYEINEKERCVETVDRWTIDTVMSIGENLRECIKLSDEESWEILRRASDYANRMDVRITEELLESKIYKYIEEKGE